MDKLTKKDKLIFAGIILLILATFVFVLLTRTLSGDDAVVESYNFSDSVYDISVINNATYDDFLAVKGIGDAKATAIVEYREAVGGFSDVSQLKDLSAISDKLYDAILEHFYSEE